MAAFAAECTGRGKRTDALITKMATLDVDTAPGASKYEILPMCGVAARGARAANDPTAMRALATLHDCAEDLRYRVREQVVVALSRIGEEVRGEPMVHDLAGWMDGFFHAAAVLEALCDGQWLAKIATPDVVIERLDEAWILARDAKRADSRYPGWKALIDALMKAPVEAAMRFGVPVFDLLAKWSASKDPAMRAIVDRILITQKLAGRFSTEIARVRGALTTTEAPRRDPRTYVGPTRGRGRKGRRA